MRNLYVYFWRWATWKAFGADRAQSEQEVEAARDRDGVVCYITAAGFLNGPGFEKMRADLRRDCSEIWVIDCSPEGHQPPVPTRIFEGVQQPVCIVLAARPPGTDATPARVRFTALPTARARPSSPPWPGWGSTGRPGPTPRPTRAPRSCPPPPPTGPPSPPSATCSPTTARA